MRAAAKIALDVLTARRSLRQQGCPGAATIDPYTVIVGADYEARLVPLPCVGAPSIDDIGPVYSIYTMMASDDRSLHNDSEDLCSKLDLLAAPAPPEPSQTAPTTVFDSPAALDNQAGFDSPASFDDPAAFDNLAALPLPTEPSWTASATATRDDPIAGLPSEHAVEGKTRRASAGARSWHRTAIIGLVAALNLLILGTVGAVVWFHPALTPGRGAPAQGAAPVPALTPLKPTPPATVSGLLAAVTLDPMAAGVDGPLLRDDLAAVASSTGEARRQNALRVLTLAANGHLAPEYARAATAATTPYTVLNAPVDIIADLAPNPALGGPNAHYVLNCMLEFQGKSPASQHDEANEVLAKIPGWASNGGIQPDLVTAVIRIVTPVAHDAAVFTDAQTGFDPARPPATDGT